MTCAVSLYLVCVSSEDLTETPDEFGVCARGLWSGMQTMELPL